MDPNSAVTPPSNQEATAQPVTIAEQEQEATFDKMATLREQVVSIDSFLGRAVLGLIVSFYLLILYAVYHTAPSSRALGALATAVAFVWATDSQGVENPDELGEPVPFRFGLTILPVQFSSSTLNFYAWILLIGALVTCYTDIQHHLADPLDRLTPAQRQQVQMQQQSEQIKDVEQWASQHPSSLSR